MFLAVHQPSPAANQPPAQGNNFVRYATDRCFTDAPDQMKPLIRAMIDAQDLGITDACKLIIDHTIDRMQSSMQPFFDEQYESATHMGSSLDYLLRIGTQRDSTEDLCTNFQVALSLSSIRLHASRRCAWRTWHALVLPDCCWAHLIVIEQACMNQ